MINKEFIRSIKKKIKSDKPEWVIRVKQKSGCSDFTISEGKRFNIAIDTVSFGYKGEYSVSSSLYIENEEISSIKQAAGIPSFRNGSGIYFGSSNLYPDNVIDELWFKNEDDEINQIEYVWGVFEKYYYPVAKGLTINYNYILDSYDNYDFLLGFFEPFITGVILAFLCNREKWIYDVLMPLTEKFTTINGNDAKDRFLKDYRKIEDAEKEVIEPVRKYFAEHDK